MTSIDATSRFLAQIRDHAGSIARQSAQADKADTNAPAAHKTRARGDPRAQVAPRVLSISPDDPHRRRKAFRIFLESVLVNEMGEELINDPAFHRIVDKVQQTMEANHELLPAIEKAGEFLLATARRKK